MLGIRCRDRTALQIAPDGPHVRAVMGKEILFKWRSCRGREAFLHSEEVYLVWVGLRVDAGEVPSQAAAGSAA